MDTVQSLSKLFTGVQIPLHPVRLDKGVIVLNVSKFIDSHLQVIKSNWGKDAFNSFAFRLHQLKRVLIYARLKKMILKAIERNVNKYPQSPENSPQRIFAAKRLDRYNKGFKKRTTKGILIWDLLVKARKSSKV